jgi:hypothetical protein
LTDHPKTTGSTAFIGGGHANVIKSLSISKQSSIRLSNPPPASAKQTNPLSAGRRVQLTILKRAMGFHRSLPNSSQTTLLKLKEARFRDGYWPNAKLFMFPMYWPIPNTLTWRRQLPAFVPYLVFQCCAKMRTLGYQPPFLSDDGRRHHGRERARSRFNIYNPSAADCGAWEGRPIGTLFAAAHLVR